MKNKNLRVLAPILMGTMIAMSQSFAFAATTTTTTTTAAETKEKPKMPENMIFGKITAISKDSMTISVATMKERPEGKDGEKMAPPEKPANDSTKDSTTPPEKPANDSTKDSTTPPEKPTDDGTKREKPNDDDMFTLTGETKTIDISSATFGHDGKRPDDKKSNETSSTTETEKAKTYANYSVGDYVGIELTNSTSTVAKSVREAFGGPMGGGGPKDGGKAPEKK